MDVTIILSTERLTASIFTTDKLVEVHSGKRQTEVTNKPRKTECAVTTQMTIARRRR